MVNVIFSTSAAKYLKKIKDKKLKSLFKEKIDMVLLNPFAGEAKTGDLAGVYCMDIRYDKTEFRIAYTITGESTGITIFILMAGTHENFYETLKRYMH